MQHTDLIEHYARQARRPAQWIEGLTPPALLALPVPGTWSIQQLVVHVLDSDLIATHRMRRIIAEENPLLIGYNETLFARNLRYEKANLKTVCDLFELNRRFTADTLRQLPDEVFGRTGVHNERGKVSLEQMLTMYIGHVDHHEKFLKDKRKALGQPLA